MHTCMFVCAHMLLDFDEHTYFFIDRVFAKNRHDIAPWQIFDSIVQNISQLLIGGSTCWWKEPVLEMQV